VVDYCCYIPDLLLLIVLLLLIRSSGFDVCSQISKLPFACTETFIVRIHIEAIPVPKKKKS